MDKKGISTFNTMLFIPRLIFLTIVALAIVMLAFAALKLSVKVAPQEMSIFTQRLFYTEPFATYDPFSQRLHPIPQALVLDDQDFSFQLADRFFYGEDNTHIAAKITIISDKNYTNYFNPGKQQGYDEYIVLADAAIKGPGGAVKQIFALPNAIFSDQNTTGLLTITVTKREG